MMIARTPTIVVAPGKSGAFIYQPEGVYRLTKVRPLVRAETGRLETASDPVDIIMVRVGLVILPAWRRKVPIAEGHVPVSVEVANSGTTPKEIAVELSWEVVT